MRNSFCLLYRDLGGRAKLTAMSPTILFVLAWAIGAGLTSAKIDLLEARKAGYAADVELLGQSGPEDGHFTQEEVSDFLSKQVRMLVNSAKITEELHVHKLLAKKT